MNKTSVLACAVFGLMSLGSGGAGSHDALPPSQSKPADVHATKSAETVTPETALKRLVEGNQRFVAETSRHSHLDQARRCDTVANGQHPFATILACADSRAPVELLFDQGIGDLFVIRVAGNVADIDEIGTIEYGVGHLHSPLVVVLGHTKCGAVTAVVNDVKLPKNIAGLVDNIIPAAKKTKSEHADLHGDALITAAVEDNVFQSMADLFKGSEEVRHLASEGKVQVVGAVYDLHNGTVRFLGRHPDEAKLLTTPDGISQDSKPSDSHGTGASKHDDAHDASEASTKEGHTDASSPSKSSGKSRSLWIPAAFLGSACAVSSVVIYAMKPSGKTGL